MHNKLGFNDRWVALGVVTDADIQRIVQEFEASDDKNTEHYRYGAFKKFFAANQPFSPERVRELYDLADRDPDPGMGGSLLVEIVALPECPDDILDRAASDTKRRHLVKFATMYKEWRTARREQAEPA